MDREIAISRARERDDADRLEAGREPLEGAERDAAIRDIASDLYSPDESCIDLILGSLTDALIPGPPINGDPWLMSQRRLAMAHRDAILAAVRAGDTPALGALILSTIDDHADDVAERKLDLREQMGGM